MSETRNIDAGSVPVVLGAGFTALDTVVSSERRRVVRCFLGGTCGNVLSILSALNWQCYPIGRLDPEDPAVSFLADELACWGVRRDLLHLAPTARVPIVAQRNKASPGGRFQHAFSHRCAQCRRHLPGYAPVRIDSATQILKDLGRPSLASPDTWADASKPPLRNWTGAMDPAGGASPTPGRAR